MEEKHYDNEKAKESELSLERERELEKQIDELKARPDSENYKAEIIELEKKRLKMIFNRICFLD